AHVSQHSKRCLLTNDVQLNQLGNYLRLLPFSLHIRIQPRKVSWIDFDTDAMPFTVVQTGTGIMISNPVYGEFAVRNEQAAGNLQQMVTMHHPQQNTHRYTVQPWGRRLK